MHIIVRLYTSVCRIASETSRYGLSVPNDDEHPAGKKRANLQLGSNGTVGINKASGC